MSNWDIQPAGVRGVLTRVETHAGDLGTAANALVTDLENCASAIGQSIVAKALSDFATARLPELQSVAARMTAAMTGTVEAVTDYVHGNLTMATQAQTVAAQMPVQVPVPPGAGHRGFAMSGE